MSGIAHAARHMRGRGWWQGLLALALLALLAAAVWGWLDYSRFERTPLATAGAGSSINIARGSSFRDIVAQLRQRHLTRAPLLYWRALAARMHVADRLHAGEYALTAGLTPRQLLERMAAGKVLQHDFTIVDGWSFDQLRAALAVAPQLRHAGAGMDNAAVMAAIGHVGQAPEGRFLPETYAWVLGDSDLDILKRSYAAMGKLLAQQWPERAKDLPLDTPYQALILASIVEKETAQPAERARIAGVFVRRLQKHMLLQTDPTVIYGLGAAYDGRIHSRDLTTDTPYNTYMHPGLPPTPIALPGRPAIVAALHPAPGDALYFVSRGNGTHAFSATLAEHDRKVACYQLKRCP